MRTRICLFLSFAAIFATNAHAQTWDSVCTGRSGELRFISKTRGWIGSDRTTDGGKTWSLDTMAPMGSFPFYGRLYTVSPHFIYDSSKHFLKYYYTSFDSGDTWQRVGDTKFDLSWHPGSFLFTSHQHGIAIEARGVSPPTLGIAATSDGGLTWSNPLTVASGDEVGNVSVSFKDDLFGVASTWDESIPRPYYTYLFNTSDGGWTWIERRTIDSAKYALAFAWLHDNVCLSSDGFRSSDAGRTWSKVSSFQSDYLVRTSDHLVLAVSGGRLFYSEDDGVTWKPQYVRRTNASIVDINFPTSQLGFLLYGDGTLWRTDVGGMDGVVSLPQKSSALGDIHISENPFAHSTNVTIDLPQATYLRFEVFDQLGRRVTEDASERLYEAGHNSFPISGRDLINGFYYARFSTHDGAVESVKLSKRE